MIKVDNISYSYPKSGTDIIKKMSFEIGKGEIYGFLGPSGAGKSTTQNILIKLSPFLQYKLTYMYVSFQVLFNIFPNN